MFDVTPEHLDDPEFKEDSVREEIVMPILRRLGFGPSDPNKIVRSRSLVHPFVRIGTKKHKISIIPDYLLEVDNQPCAVIDAKRPAEQLINSHHAEQAYSYAIHPEVRCRWYALCNGRQFVIYDRDRFHPALTVDFTDIERRWDQIESFLSPLNISRIARLNFHPDLGLVMSKRGLIQTDFHFLFAWISDISRVSSELLTSSPTTDIGDITYALSFDFPRSQFSGLFRYISDRDKVQIETQLISEGDGYQLIDPFYIQISCRLGNLQHAEHEDYIPFIVEDISDSPA